MPPLKAPLENRLVVDEEPYVLPLLELWHGEPSYLIAVIDFDHAHIFEAHHGDIEEVRQLAKFYKGTSLSTRSARKPASRQVKGLQRLKKARAVGTGQGVDWTSTVEQFLQAIRR